MSLLDGFLFWLGKIIAEITFGVVIFLALAALVGILEYRDKQRREGAKNERR